MDGLKKKKEQKKKKALDHHPDYWYTESTLNEGNEALKKKPGMGRSKKDHERNRDQEKG